MVFVKKINLKKINMKKEHRNKLFINFKVNNTYYIAIHEFKSNKL